MLRALIGFLCVCFSISAQARLGETVPQLIKRFGNNYTIESDAAGKRYKFRSQKLSADVLVSGDVSIAETYFSDKPLTASGEPSSDIVRAILNENVPQSRWTEIDASPFEADYALRSFDQKHIAFLKYRRPQPEGFIWTITIGRKEVLGSFSSPALSPLAPATTPVETIMSSPTQTARTADTSEPSATSKPGPKPGETKEQYEQRVLAEQRARDLVAKATATPDVAPDHWRIPGGESKWEYQERPDQMGRGVMQFAHVDSLTTLNLGFPYEGPQLMRLVLQRRAKGENGAYIKVDHGQFHIRYPHSNFTIRFDKGKLQTFPFDPSDDGRSNLALLGYGQYDRFIALLRKAKTMDIEVDFYGQGSQVVTFDVHGLQGW
jgi:hypothetical protein